MTALVPSVDGGTSMGGAERARVVGLLAGVALLASPLTMTTAWGAPSAVVIRRSGETTGSGGYVESFSQDLPQTALAIREVRARSALTWDELAKVFGVSRRAVHAWATGTRLNQAHAARLLRVVAVVNDYDQRDPAKTRAALLAPSATGRSSFEQLTRSAPGHRNGYYTPAQLLADEPTVSISDDPVIEVVDVD